MLSFIVVCVYLGAFVAETVHAFCNYIRLSNSVRFPFDNLSLDAKTTQQSTFNTKNMNLDRFEWLVVRFPCVCLVQFFVFYPMCLFSCDINGSSSVKVQAIVLQDIYKFVLME